MDKKPIGIFDSGIGGLTVVRAIWKKLPQESLIYLGDTARVPYGTRGKEVICQFALELVRFLLKKEVKALVVACNTISSTCIEEVKALSPVPVIDAVNPAVEAAVKATRSGAIGIVGTNATISSGIYEKKIKSLNSKIKVISKACPLFVPIAEEGLAEHQVAYLMAKDYLKVFSKIPLDTLVLGCTHYPLLKKAIQKALKRKACLPTGTVEIIDSASPIAWTLEKVLQKENLLRHSSRPSYQFLVTDNLEKVSETARRFFNGPLPGAVEKITLKP